MENYMKKVIREDVERWQYVRMGIIMFGIGDGLGIGEECFFWIDIFNVKSKCFFFQRVSC